MDEEVKELIAKYKKLLEIILEHEHDLREHASKGNPITLVAQPIVIRLELDVGLCWNLKIQPLKCYDNYTINTGRKRLRTLMGEWPEGSGDESYPVQGFDGKDAEDAYDFCIGDPKLMWGEGQYADARWNLVRYLAGVL